MVRRYTVVVTRPHRARLRLSNHMVLNGGLGLDQDLDQDQSLDLNQDQTKTTIQDQNLQKVVLNGLRPWPGLEANISVSINYYRPSLPHRTKNYKMLGRDVKNSATCEPLNPQLTNTIVAEFDFIDLYARMAAIRQFQNALWPHNAPWTERHVWFHYSTEYTVSVTCT